MLVWRRRNDGFEWHKHVRTTIRLKRADRRRRIEGARDAAVEGLKSAGRVSAEAGSSGLSLAGTWARAALALAGSWARCAVTFAASSVRACLTLAGSCARGALTFALHASRTAASALQAGFVRLVEATPPAWAWLRSAISNGLRIACGLIQCRGVQPLLSGIGIVAVIAALIGLLAFGSSDYAGLAFLLGLAALLIAGLPVLLGNQALTPLRHRRVPSWLSARLAALPLPRNLPRVSGMQLASTAVALLITASAVLGGAWLLWRGFALVAGATSLFTQTVEGRASAIAGDVLRIGDTEIRLAGVEAPDLGQICARPGNRRWRCGMDARSALGRRVRGATVSCTVSGKDDNGRALGTCLAEGEDIAETLVRAGHVFAEAGLFSKYASLEEAARTAKEGLWRGDPERPAEYRAKIAERLAKAWEKAKQAAPGGCPIKGRIASGKKYYVLPGTADYQRIRIRARRGERWFCSEEEAQAAGWRRAPLS